MNSKNLLQIDKIFLMKKDKKIILKGENITKTFPAKTGDERLTVLDNLSMSIQEGSIVSVIGASGSGKSTLLHILGGLDKPDSGQVIWQNRSMYAMKTQELATFRNKNLGFVFQFHHLLPEFSALENVMMPLLISGTEFDEARTKALQMLDRFDIPGRAQHRPTELSGGEQQRVAMSRALINNPDLILADEPTGNLDEENTEIMLEMLFALRDTDGVSILLITHEKEIANRTDKIDELRKGALHSF